MWTSAWVYTGEDTRSPNSLTYTRDTVMITKLQYNAMLHKSGVCHESKSEAISIFAQYKYAIWAPETWPFGILRFMLFIFIDKRVTSLGLNQFWTHLSITFTKIKCINLWGGISLAMLSRYKQQWRSLLFSTNIYIYCGLFENFKSFTY